MIIAIRIHHFLHCFALESLFPTLCKDSISGNNQISANSYFIMPFLLTCEICEIFICMAVLKDASGFLEDKKQKHREEDPSVLHTDLKDGCVSRNPSSDPSVISQDSISLLGIGFAYA